MGVYIKGIEMPKSCLACPFKEYGSVDEFKYYCSILNAYIGRWSGRKIATERLPDCPLVEVKETEDE